MFCAGGVPFILFMAQCIEPIHPTHLPEARQQQPRVGNRPQPPGHSCTRSTLWSRDIGHRRQRRPPTEPVTENRLQPSANRQFSGGMHECLFESVDEPSCRD